MSNANSALLLKLAPSIYGPTILFTLGEYAVLPLIPVIAVQMGASLGLSGFIASAVVVGQLAGNLPASWVVSRAGERIAMLIAAAVALVATIGIALAPTPALLGLAVFVVGFAAATFGLARHSFMTTRVPVAFRARALSLIGGSHRLGRFAGPFLAAALVALTGNPGATIWAFMGCLVLAALLVGLAPDPERLVPLAASGGTESGGAGPSGAATGGSATGGTGIPNTAIPNPDQRPGGILAAIRAGHAPLLRVGGCAAILSGLRSVKDVFLPLWGLSIGMDAPGIALVVGISGTIDFALFYTSGQVMDRFGRLWAALPATAAMALSFLVLSLTHDVPGAVGWLIACAVVIGIGNGLSSGIVLTLGADLAPMNNPAPFLAAWRTLVDFGGAAAPLAVSAISVASLPIASAATGVLAILGVAGFARWVPRYIPRARGMRR
ncbi:MFS transporter [Leucobacter rhizosphaerae]|uniref:MFS transporter n=1 Tax=Leucobacter rhizosphaerae TaxID=2932245 RepID=A0ABY4FRT9_9MICO|nr:MFS transporter [Leucobacter rhizosphaerae]UOQ59015.1 MFS transporter [Leucobacter rhizosphaerae]